MTNTITIHNFTGPFAVSGATYGVILDPEDRSVRDWTGVGPGVPGEVWHRRAILLVVSASTHPASLQEVFAENLDLVEEVFEAYRGPVWNGSNQSGLWKGSNEDGYHMRACEADIDALQQAADRAAKTVSVDDWFGNAGCTLADLGVSVEVDQTLEAIAADIVEDAEMGGDVLFAGDKQAEAVDYLLYLVREELDDAESIHPDDLDEDDVAWLAHLRGLEAR
tara:strand:+ start:256 stop:921 length:666 start_codon:yes stop_codon:yes gene_type:complete